MLSHEIDARLLQMMLMQTHHNVLLHKVFGSTSPSILSARSGAGDRTEMNGRYLVCHSYLLLYRDPSIHATHSKLISEHSYFGSFGAFRICK